MKQQTHREQRALRLRPGSSRPRWHSCRTEWIIRDLLDEASALCRAHFGPITSATSTAVALNNSLSDTAPHLAT